MLGFISASVFAQEPCLTNAENALNQGNYADVIKYADECIDNFGKAALRIQQNLDANHTTVPNGAPASDIEKNRVFSNGLLNDVATACFYKGKAAEALYNKNKAKNITYKQTANDAYKLTLQYSKGRHWDPKGWFWSPAEAASDRLPVQ
jgi:hypothetical protein